MLAVLIVCAVLAATLIGLFAAMWWCGTKGTDDDV